jgi:hypothetical protein
MHGRPRAKLHRTSCTGLIYKDFKVGEGDNPVDGQEVTFAYTAYNESGGLIDSTYRQGRNASTQVGINGLIPGAQPQVPPSSSLPKSASMMFVALITFERTNMIYCNAC